MRDWYRKTSCMSARFGGLRKWLCRCFGSTHLSSAGSRHQTGSWGKPRRSCWAAIMRSCRTVEDCELLFSAGQIPCRVGRLWWPVYRSNLAPTLWSYSSMSRCSRYQLNSSVFLGPWQALGATRIASGQRCLRCTKRLLPRVLGKSAVTWWWLLAFSRVNFRKFLDKWFAKLHKLIASRKVHRARWRKAPGCVETSSRSTWCQHRPSDTQLQTGSAALLPHVAAGSPGGQTYTNLQCRDGRPRCLTVPLQFQMVRTFEIGHLLSTGLEFVSFIKFFSYTSFMTSASLFSSSLKTKNVIFFARSSQIGSSEWQCVISIPVCWSMKLNSAPSGSNSYFAITSLSFEILTVTISKANRNLLVRTV